MSIINEALKKARREADVSGDPVMQGEDNVISPRRRVSKKPGIMAIFPGILLIIVFICLVAGLGYFMFEQYFSESSSDSAPPETAQVETVDLESQPLEEDLQTVVEAKPPEAMKEEEPQGKDPVAVSSSEHAAALSQFEINGVMRGGSSVRVISNSGVYRIGDTVTAPAGYVLEAIGDSHLTLRAPDGTTHPVSLP